jgi:hypothetical protein
MICEQDDVYEVATVHTGTARCQKIIGRPEALVPLPTVVSNSFLQAAIAKKVKTPTGRIPDQIRRQPSIEGGEPTLTIKDMANNPK